MSTGAGRSPTEGGWSRRGGALVVAVATIAVALGWWAAPANWPDGRGTLEVTVAGRQATPVPVEVGSTDPVVVEQEVGARTLVLEAPEGLSTDAPVTLAVQVRESGAPVRPAVEDVQVTLVLPDGRREPIPVTRWDAEDEALVATRRPAAHAGVTLALLGLVVVLWVSALVPLFVTSLLVPVVLVVGGAASASDALAPFFHPIIALFFAGFLMAEAMQRAGLDDRIARQLVSRADRGPRALFAMLLGTAAVLSMWMSNTAAITLLIPIVLAVTEPLDSPGYRRAAILGIAYAATAGGVGSAIGTPANLLAIEFLDTFAGREITFLRWFTFGLPMVALLVPLIGLHLWRRFDVRVDPATFAASRAAVRDELAHAHPISGAELQVLAVLALVAATWLTAGWHGLDTGIVALAGAVVLAALGRVRPEDLGRISWSSLLTFGGGLTLGLALTTTGVADWVATRLGGLAGIPGPVAIAVVATVALVTTTVASNTAAAATLIPLGIPLATVLGLDPTQVVVVIAVASSIDFALVIGTPPTMLAYSTGLFRPPEILRVGSVLDGVGIVLLVAVATLVWPWLAMG